MNITEFIRPYGRISGVLMGTGVFDGVIIIIEEYLFFSASYGIVVVFVFKVLVCHGFSPLFDFAIILHDALYYCKHNFHFVLIFLLQPSGAMMHGDWIQKENRLMAALVT